MLRFALSPTKDMHIDDLRVAIFNYLHSLQINDNFIVRIEDIAKVKNIDGKDEEILMILEKFAIIHSQKLYQSENLHIHQTLAIRLLQEKKAFISIYNSKDKEDNLVDNKLDIKELKESKIPFVISLKKQNDDIDSFVILQEDGLPTLTFSSACDDMLSGVDFIIDKEENISNIQKQEYIKKALGYDLITKYAHLPTILNVVDDKFTIKWLLQEGFLPDAIINYLILLGNNNQAPKEIFTLPEALEWFKLENISTEAISFDIDKLKSINKEHIRLMDDKKLSTLFGFSEDNIGKLAKLYLQEVSTINQIDEKIKLVFSQKELIDGLAEEMKIIQDIILNAPMFQNFDDFKEYIISNSKIEEKKLLKSLRVLITGEEQGVDLSEIYPLIKSYITEIIL